ncbi:MAG: hypothetical protein KA369_05630 [Spirochaetes bacterium]|nr:hypothetical protein [Spirochaetota bacterium]
MKNQSSNDQINKSGIFIIRIIQWILVIFCLFLGIGFIADGLIISTIVTFALLLFILPAIERFYKAKLPFLQPFYRRFIIGVIIFIAGLGIEAKTTGYEAVKLTLDKEPAEIIFMPEYVFSGQVGGNETRLTMNGKKIESSNGKFRITVPLIKGENKFYFILEGYSRNNRKGIEKIEKSYKIKYLTTDEYFESIYNAAEKSFRNKEYNEALKILTKISQNSKYNESGIKLRKMIEKEIEKNESVSNAKIIHDDKVCDEVDLYKSIKTLKDASGHEMGHSWVERRLSINECNNKEIMFRVLEKYYREKIGKEYGKQLIFFYTTRFAKAWNSNQFCWIGSIRRIPVGNEKIQLIFQTDYDAQTKMYNNQHDKFVDAD